MSRHSRQQQQPRSAPPNDDVPGAWPWFASLPLSFQFVPDADVYAGLSRAVDDDRARRPVEPVAADRPAADIVVVPLERLQLAALALDAAVHGRLIPEHAAVARVRLTEALDAGLAHGRAAAVGAYRTVVSAMKDGAWGRLDGALQLTRAAIAADE